MSTKLAQVVVRASSDEPFVVPESFDPLLDFTNIERFIGFANTGDDETGMTVSSAALWETHDYWCWSDENGHHSSFQFSVRMVNGRIPLRYLFAVWSIVISPQLRGDIARIEMDCLGVGEVKKSVSSPAYLEKSCGPPAAQSEDRSSCGVPLEVNGHNSPPIRFAAENSDGDHIERSVVEFTPLRVAEVFEMLVPDLSGSYAREFSIRARRKR